MRTRLDPLCPGSRTTGHPDTQKNHFMDAARPTRSPSPVRPSQAEPSGTNPTGGEANPRALAGTRASQSGSLADLPRLRGGMHAPGPLRRSANLPDILAKPDMGAAIAATLSTQDLVHLAQASKPMRAVAQPKLDQARRASIAAQQAIEQVHTPADFYAVLGDAHRQVGDGSNTVRGLPQNLQAKLLPQLALRMGAFHKRASSGGILNPGNVEGGTTPEQAKQGVADWKAVKETFVAAVNALESAHRTPQLQALARIASYPSAVAAIEAGEHVADSVAVNGPRSSAHAAAAMQTNALREGHPFCAKSLISKGEKVTDVARAKGLDWPLVIVPLELHALTTLPGGMQAVTELAAAGHPIGHLAQERGITTAEVLGEIEQAALAAQGPASPSGRVHSGANVDIVAHHFGLVSQAARGDLENVSINSRAPGSAGDLVQRGLGAAVIAQATGISSVGGIETLRVAVEQAQQQRAQAQQG